VEGTAWENKKVQGLFKEIGPVDRYELKLTQGLAWSEPWIVDPTAVVVVDHAVSSAHGSTVDQVL
jgi:hypothetical protein